MDIKTCFPSWNALRPTHRQRLRRFVPNVSHPAKMAHRNPNWSADAEASYQHWRETVPYTNDEIADAYVLLAKTAQPLLARAYLARASQLRKGWRLRKSEYHNTTLPSAASHAKFQRADRKQPVVSQQDEADYLKVTGRKPKPALAKPFCTRPRQIR